MEGVDRRDVDLAAMLHAQLDGTKYSAAALFTARYPVRCVHKHIDIIGPSLEEVPVHLHTKPEDYQVKPFPVATKLLWHSLQHVSAGPR